MKNTKIAGMLAAVLLLSMLFAPSALAATAEGGCCPREPQSTGTVKDMPKDDLKFHGFKRYDEFFDKLVTEGAINTEQKDAIKSALENAAKDARQQGLWKIDMSMILAALVKQGAITQDQMTTVENALKAERFGFMTRRLKAAMGHMISSGTMTEQEAQKILDAVAAAVKSGGPVDLKTLLEDLQKSGAITDEQLAAIQKALTPPAHDKKPPQ